MAIILNGTTGITTPDITSSGSLNIDASAPDNSLVVNSAGNVGIGTSSPAAKLHSDVSGAASLCALNLTNSGSGFSAGVGPSINFGLAYASLGAFGKIEVLNQTATIGSNSYMAFSTRGGDVLAEKMRINSAGNVGIGTVSPNYKLSVNGVGNFYSGVPGLGRMFLGDPEDAGGYIGLYRSSLGPSNSTVIGNSLNFAAIDGYTFSTGAVVFGSQTERMRINSAGNVGIGTSSPSAPLEVNGTATAVRATSAQLWLSRTNTSTHYQGICFQRGLARDAFIGRPPNSDDITFGFDAGSVLAEAMRIDIAGNVGIGTSSPGELLHLNKASGDTALRIQSTGGNCYVVNRAASAGMDLLNAMNGPMTFGTNNAERMRIDSIGRVLVNATSDVGGNNPAFTVNAAAAGVFGNIIESRWTGTNSIWHLLVRNGNGLIGGINSSGSTTSFVTSSDHRLKDTIAPMAGALSLVQQLKPVTYKWKADGSSGQGFIAHELQAVVPECVTGEKDAVDAEGKPKYQGVDQSKLVPLLTAALQEALTKIDSLTARLDAANL